MAGQRWWVSRQISDRFSEFFEIRGALHRMKEIEVNRIRVSLGFFRRLEQDRHARQSQCPLCIVLRYSQNPCEVFKTIALICSGSGEAVIKARATSKDKRRPWPAEQDRGRKANLGQCDSFYRFCQNVSQAPQTQTINSFHYTHP